MINRTMKRWKLHKIIHSVLIMVMAMIYVPVSTATPASAADEYDGLIAKWTANFTGGTGIDTSDPGVVVNITNTTKNAQNYWNDLIKTADRTYLFADLSTQYPNQHITDTYMRIKAMAVAYATEGSSLYQDAALLSDIMSALEWLNVNWYNDTTAYGTQSSDNNWFVWEIGAPWQLEDTMALLYSHLTADQMDRYNRAIEHWVVTPNDTGTSMGQRWGNSGANLAWKSLIWSQLGILKKNGTMIGQGRDALSPLFTYAASGDGFYEDGSFIQHGAFPYSAGYGLSNLGSSVDLIYLLGNTPWAVADSKSSIIKDWIYKSYEPLIFQNRIFDNLSGRYISRYDGADGVSSIITPVYKIADMLKGTTDETRLKSFIKYLISSDSGFDFTKRDIFFNTKIKALMNDSSIPVRPDQTLYKQFPQMDRFSWLRPDSAFSVGMSSSRMNNYESINYENLMGWHSDDGRTSLYTGDPTQFDDYYWSTIDSYRLPGTTAEAVNPSDVNSPQIGNVTITTDGNTLVDDLTTDHELYKYTANWQFVTDSLDGDSSRIKRKYDTLEYLTYNKPNISSFQAVAYVLNDRTLNGKVSLYYSPDNKDWKAIGIALSTPAPVSGTNWNKVTVSPADQLPAGTNFIKMEFPSTESPESRLTGESWVGGTDMNNLYGVSGMQMHSVGESLIAKKSWFMFDNEIVALGADIQGGDGNIVESTVENRKLNAAGNNALTVNGVVKPSALGWKDTLSNVQWMHLAGNVSGSDVGYYFPGGSNLKATREARSGSPSEISHGGGEDTTVYKRNYMTFWYDHGQNPGEGSAPSGSYAYTLLPNRSADQVAAYAANPDITVLENSADAQAVRENTLQMQGINFWKDQIKQAGNVKVNRKASVMVKENADQTLEVSISDPTQLNGGSIDVEIMKSANPNSGWISDPAITVYQTSPTIRFQVNVNAAKGKSFKAKFNLGSSIWPQQPPAPTPAKESLSFTDEMNDFGKVYSVSDSSELFLDNSSPANFGNDSSRVKRYKKDIPQSLVYQVTDVIGLSAKLFYRSGYGDKIKAYASPDNHTWTPIALVPDTPIKNTDNDWYRANFTPAAGLPKGTQFVKIEIGNDPLLYSPQLGSVTFNRAPIQYVTVDDMNDWSKAYKHTLAWDFDSANAAAQFEGDLSRLRASIDGQYVQYKAEGVIGFKAKVYANNASLDGLLTAEVSFDEQTWLPVRYAVDGPFQTAGGINKFVLTSSGALAQGANYIRFQVAKSDTAKTVELGYIALESGAFTDPLNNFDYMVSHTTNLAFEKNPATFEGDGSLIKRSGTNIAGNMVYYYPNVSDFALKMYALSGFAGKINVYASRDGVQWKAVVLKNDPIVTTSTGWNKTIFRADKLLDAGNNYIKFEIGNDIRVYSPMISEATLFRTLNPDGPLPDPVVGPETITDTFIDWSKSFTHSSGWQFDSSNAPYFDGDTSRLKRSSDTPHEVVYNYQNTVDFQASVYSCVEAPAHPLDLENQVKLYASSDGQIWTSIPYVYSAPVGATCWKQSIVTPKDDLPLDTQYMKIVVDHDTRVYAPQLTEVKLVADGAISKRINSFSVGERQVGPALIDRSSRTVSIHVKAGTDLTTLKPVITTTDKTSMTPQSGVAQNFTKQVVYKVTATDKTEVNWTVQVIADPDVTKPVTTLDTSGQQGSNDWYTSPVTLTLKAEDDASGVDVIQYSLNSGEWLMYVSPVALTEDGSYTFDYRSIDKAGNIEETHHQSFKLDQKAPVISFASVKTSYDAGESLTVTDSAYDAMSGLQSISLILNGTELAQDKPITLTILGINELTITAVDQAGNSITETMKLEVFLKAAQTATPNNLSINSGVFTVRVDLPESYTASSAVADSIRLNNTIKPISVKVLDDKGQHQLLLKFERSDLNLATGSQKLEVIGQFQGDTVVRFRSSSTVTIK